jgi:tRNA modification GTPase
MYNDTTICAISTAAGIGGIAIIRISGKEAFAICDKIFFPTKQGKLSEQKGYTIHFGQIKKGETIIDEVLVSVFHSPHSFTGEDCIEISCHGSIFIQQKILQLLLENGAVLAQAGEFTQRAFLNGKMDLSQAEAVADLIASNSAASHKLAMTQMRGGFSNELIKLRAQLLNFTSLIELELDFNEEDVEFADRKDLSKLANEIAQLIDKLCRSFSLGNVIKNGIPVAIVGETNVGKSTLLNVLLNEERAIVSDIHGTTRDVIEDTINIEGLMFRFIDTAGIRETKDTIENLGIERTYQKIEQASIVLWLIDSTQISEHIEWMTERIVKTTEGKKLILVFNKLDKITDEEHKVIEELFKPIDAEKIYISAKEQINTEELKKALVVSAQIAAINNNDVIVTNARHYEALKNAHQAILRVIDGLETNLSGDFLSQDIREVIFHLGSITGTVSTDEILGNIFSKFCIGK